MAALADALRQFGAAYLATHALSTPQAKAWRAIVACRTAALGGQQLACDTCGHSHWQYHSCRHRCCSQCGTRAKDAWLQGRLAEVLPVPYAHLVFTLPHSLNGLYGMHPRWVIDTLFTCTAQTLAEFAANPEWMGSAHGAPAFSLVLHTWSQDLQRHIHVHAVMACGVLDKEAQWATPTRKPNFLFPVHALSRVFRGKFMAALMAAHQNCNIEHDPQGDAPAWLQRQRQLYKHDWVVYAKAPMGGPAQVLEYLGRYTHRVAISDERILGMDGSAVRFRVRDPANSKRKKVERVEVNEFIRRFLLHVLPEGFKRIRHYGLLGPARKTARLAAARAALEAPTPDPVVVESAEEFMRRVAGIEWRCCPHCREGRFGVVEVILPPQHAPPSRGPP